MASRTSIRVSVHNAPNALVDALRSVDGIIYRSYDNAGWRRTGWHTAELVKDDVIVTFFADLPPRDYSNERGR